MKTALCVIASSFLAAATPALATSNQADDDHAAIIAAYDAINSKNFEVAISKADTVIKRFEAGKPDDSVYRCTSGVSDTVATLGRAAHEAKSGETDPRKTDTVAVAADICSAYFVKGFALIDLGKRDEALPNFEMAVQMDPDNQHYLNELGEWYKAGRDWHKSLSIFTKASDTTDFSIAALEDKKQSAEILNAMRCRSYRGIAFNHVELGNWKEARSAIDKCLKLIPDDPRSNQELQYIITQSAE